MQRPGVRSSPRPPIESGFFTRERRISNNTLRLTTTHENSQSRERRSRFDHGSTRAVLVPAVALEALPDRAAPLALAELGVGPVFPGVAARTRVPPDLIAEMMRHQRSMRDGGGVVAAVMRQDQVREDLEHVCYSFSLRRFRMPVATTFQLKSRRRLVGTGVSLQ